MKTRDAGSLNYLEINLLLAEIDLAGSQIQEVYQPRPEELILVMYHKGKRLPLLFCLSQKACRFHLLSKEFEKGAVRQRFVSFLAAHAVNSCIQSIEHVADERILKISLKRGERKSILWVRLWSSAPNIIFTDESGRIGDALFRRPKKGEISGGTYDPQQDFRKSPPRPADLLRFTARDFTRPETAGRSLHERVEAYFRELSSGERETGWREKILNQMGVEENRLQKALDAAETWLEEHAGSERYKEYGDLIMSSLAAIEPGAEWFHGRDFYHGDAPIEIRLDKSLSPAQNAENYYRLHKKNKSVAERTALERDALRRKLETVRARRAEVEGLSDPERLEELGRKMFKTSSVQTAKDTPGLRFSSQGFTILVGRTGKENEELFRRHVRGNDYWMHARDYPGASVFIKSRKEKSVPLEVLLDAGNAALFYSKAKNSARADLYYTQVKYLKKAKGPKPGLFLPTHEKNLAVRLEAERIDRLKKSAETFD